MHIIEKLDPTDLTRTTDYTESAITASFMNEADGMPGAGTVVLSQEEAWRFVEGDYLRVTIEGSARGIFEVTAIKETVYDVSGGQANGVEISGPGVLDWMKNAILFPENKKTLYASTMTRLFSFASAEGSWYKGTEWSLPVNVSQVRSTNPPWNSSHPDGWPTALTAHWIWDRPQATNAQYAPAGEIFFRRKFVTTTTRNFKIFYASDDFSVLFINGEQLVTLVDKYNHTAVTIVEVQLPPGTHTIAVHARQVGTGGPAGVAMCMVNNETQKEDDAFVNADRVVWTGDSGWLMNPYPANAPGWTVGEMMTALIDEAKSRQVAGIPLLTPTWTATTDSSGDDWGEVRDFAFEIGQKYSDVIETVVANGYQVWVSGEGELHISKLRGKNRTTKTTSELNATLTARGFPADGVPLAGGQMLLEGGSYFENESSERSSEITNFLLTKTSGAFVEHDGPAASVTKYGRRESFAKVDAPIGSVSIDRTASQVFSKFSNPDDVRTYTMTPDMAMIEKLSVGDWVDVYEEKTKTFVPRLVMSTSLEDDQTSGLTYVLELDSVKDVTGRRISRWIENPHGSLSGGIISDGAAAAYGAPAEQFSGPPTTGSTKYDARAPKAPTLGVVTPSTYRFGGRLVGEIVANFTHDGLATNGAPIEITRHDVYYRVVGTTQWKLLASGPWGVTKIDYQPVAIRNDAKALIKYEVRMRSASVQGIVSAFSTTKTITMADDLTPPAKTSKPIVSSVRSVASIKWDGLDFNALAMADDTSHIVTYRGLSATSTPDVVGSTLSAAGANTDPNLNYGVTYFYRFRAFDYTGNVSPYSDATSVVVQPLVDADLFDTTINDRLIASLTAAEAAETAALQAVADAEAAEVAATNAAAAAEASEGHASTSEQAAISAAAAAEADRLAAVAAQSAAEAAEIAADASQQAATLAQQQAAAAATAAGNSEDALQQYLGEAAIILRQAAAPDVEYQRPGVLWIKDTDDAEDGTSWTWSLILNDWELVTDATIAQMAADADAAADAAAAAEVAAGLAQDAAATSATNAGTASAEATAAKNQATISATNSQDSAAEALASKNAADQAKADALAAAQAAVNAQNAADQAAIDAGAASADALLSRGIAEDAQTKADAATNTANSAATAASNAAGVAAGKADVLIQPTAPVAAMRKATTLWIDTTGGLNLPKRWTSGTTWVAITDKVATDAAMAAANAATAAQAAKDRADAAHQLAGEAEGTAQSALDAANGVSRNYSSTNNPSGTAPAKSIWWKFGTGGGIVGVWEQTTSPKGSNWVSRPIRSEAIDNLEVGKLSASAGGFTQLVAESFNATAADFLTARADWFQANKIEADWVGVGAIEAQHMSIGSVSQRNLQQGMGELLLNPKWLFPEYEVEYGPHNVFIDEANTVPTLNKWHWDTNPSNLRYGQTHQLIITGSRDYGTRWPRMPLGPSFQASAGDKFHLGLETYAGDSTFVVHLYLMCFDANGDRISGQGSVTGGRSSEPDREWVSHSYVQTLPEGTVLVVPTLEASLAAAGSLGYIMVGAMSIQRAMQGMGEEGRSVEISPNGVRLFGEDGSEVVSLTTVPPNYLGILDSEGNTLASLSDDGTVAGHGLNIEADPVFMGTELLGGLAGFESPNQSESTGWLDLMPRGVVGRGYQNVQGRSLPSQGGKMEFGEIGFNVQKGRMYLITMEPIGIYVDPGAYGRLKIFQTQNGTSPTWNSSLVRQWVQRSGSGVTSGHMKDFGGSIYHYFDDTTTRARLLFAFESNGGAAVYDANSGGSLRVMVTDVGPVPNDGIVNRSYIQANSAPYVPPAPPPEKKNYTKTYTANGYRSYTGGGATYTISGSEPARMYQGQSPYGPTGILRSIATFPSFTGDLSGATITSVRAYFYFDHWYSNSGGSAQIMLHGQSGRPASRPSMTFATTSAKWPKPGGRWVNIPSSFWAGIKSGTYKGVGLGNGTGGNLYYGYARWSSTKIEIKYTK